MKSPVVILPGAMAAMQALKAATENHGLSHVTALLVELRASQVNGCSFCVDMHARELRKLGESEDRIAAVGAWRHAPYFSDAERAALALTEAMTRLADREDPVSDAVWTEARRHYDERALAALLLEIASINVWNRLNAAIGQVAGSWKP